MIMVYYFFSFFCLGKMEIPLCSFLLPCDNSLFLGSIIFLVCLLISQSIFSSYDSYTKKTSLALYFLVYFFLFFSFQSDSPFSFLFFFESCVVCMIFLLLNYSKNQDKISSVLFMFLSNIFGSILFMSFIFFCPLSLSNIFNSTSSSCVYFISFLLVLCSKLPVFFFHFWLTKAHVSASGSCSMILASLMLKIGSFGIFKFSPLFSLLSKTFFSGFPSFLLVSSTLFFAFMSRFSDIKYLVANSSIVHMSFSVFLLISLCPLGSCSSLFIMVGHGLISLYLFFMMGEIYESSYNRSIDHNKSIQSYSLIFTFLVFFFFLMNLGFPPTVNFFSEVLIFSLFSSISSFSGLFFCVVLQLSVLPFCGILLKMVFGKKASFLSLSSDSVFLVWGIIFSILLLLTPFLFS